MKYPPGEPVSPMTVYPANSCMTALEACLKTHNSKGMQRTMESLVSRPAAATLLHLARLYSKGSGNKTIIMDTTLQQSWSAGTQIYLTYAYCRQFKTNIFSCLLPPILVPPRPCDLPMAGCDAPHRFRPRPLSARARHMPSNV